MHGIARSRGARPAGAGLGGHGGCLLRWRQRGFVLITLAAMLVSMTPAADRAGAQPVTGHPTRSQSAPVRRVLGYYVPYDPTSWESLEANAHAIDDVAAHWVTIDACGRLGSRDNRTVQQFLQARGVRLFPSLLTLSPWLNHRLLTEDAVTATAVNQIVEYVVAEGYEGFDLDLEGIQFADRDAYSAFVARLGAALRERGKLLTLAIPPKAGDTSTGWAAGYDYAALGQHADLTTIMAYDFSGPWGEPGPVAPYDWVDRVAKYATSQIPPEKVLLGLAFYGYDWNTTSGGTRALSYSQAATLSEYHGVPMALDPETRSVTFRYRVPAGDPVPTREQPVAPAHEISVREAPPCDVTPPAPAPTPTPRPTPPPGMLQDHVVWIEEGSSAIARLGIAERHGAGGVATGRLGLEDPAVWPTFERWRHAYP